MIDLPNYNTPPSAPSEGRTVIFADGFGNLNTKDADGTVKTYAPQIDVNEAVPYGVKYDKVQDIITPGIIVNGAFVATDYQNFPIHEMCGRGLLTTDGVWSKLNRYDSTKLENGTAATLDGSVGQVMVQIPRFYQIIKTVGDYQYFLISKLAFSFDGTDAWVPPAFRDDSYRYIGAFNGVAATDSVSADVISAVKDTSGYTTNTTPNPFTVRTRAQFRTQQQTGFFQYSWGLYEILRILFLTKYKTWNSQDVLPGHTESDPFDYIKATPAGATVGLGDFDGSIYSDTDERYIANSFLGIENPFGNVWEFLDGININNTDGDCAVYICNDPDNFADDTTTNYTDTGHSPGFGDDDDYQKYILGDGKNCPFYPAAIGDGADSDSYQTDYHWNAAGGWRVLRCGGGLSYGALSGLACLHAHYGSSFSNSSISVRSAA